MTQQETARRNGMWPVVFPSEKIIVSRPSLRHICEGNADLGDLLGYFLFEAGSDAARQGADPLTVKNVTIYRTLDEILHSLDHRMSKKFLIRCIGGLENLGFLKASPYQHEYTVFFARTRRAMDAYAKSLAATRLQLRKIALPESIIDNEPEDEKDDIPDIVPEQSNVVQGQLDIVPEQSDVVQGQFDIVPGQSDVVSGQFQPPNTTIFNISNEQALQAASAHHESVSRYNRNKNKEIIRDKNREYSGEADAFTTNPSLSSPVDQTSLALSQKEHEQVGKQKGNAAKMQKEQKIVKDVGKLPEKPASDTPATVEAFLALADYYRGYRLAHSQKPNSPYRLALEAATTFVNRKKTLAEIDAVFAYMKGVDEGFCDDWWPMQTVDIWHVMRHFDSMTRKMAHRRAYVSPSSMPGAASSMKSVQSVQSSQASRGFPMQQTAEIMEMPLEERRLYLARQRELQKQQQH